MLRLPTGATEGEAPLRLHEVLPQNRFVQSRTQAGAVGRQQVPCLYAQRLLQHHDPVKLMTAVRQ